MGARTKLNTWHMYGAAVVAAFFGLATQSWTVFLVALAIAVAGGLYAGDIRPRPSPR